MATDKVLKGRKGGSSSSRTPTEQPDDLQSVAKAKILVALGEGEFAGQLTAKDIYLDGTPLENADGSQNFSGVAWEFRPGTQAQKYIQGIPGTENEISVGTEVSSATAWTRTFTNTQLSAVRLRLKWPSLFQQEDDSDLVGYSIKYAIDLQTDGGTWQTVLNTSVTGKTTSGYERSHRIDLPQAGSTWTLRLRKITADANSAKIGDTMMLQSFTEVIDAKLRYPNTALLYIEFDSSQFNGSIPQISCEPRGRVIRVPDTYDPETRTYSGTWTGAFKWAWTDNPAWIFYDLVVSDRFGLGHRLTAANIDKWTLYQVAQYCDQMVPDGKGGNGTEPRYTCNVYIQDRNDAYTVLRDFAAIFRGMTYWGGDQIVALADMPRDVDYSYTRANVVGGRFTYSSSTTKTRYTTALVSWSDPGNAYADAMEPVFEQALVARYGFNQLEMTAIGCTRQSEANRKGRWGILTNNKDRVVSFDVGLDGNIPQPGYIIAVADELLSGKVMGGRISAVNGRVIKLDRVADAAPGDRLILNLPSGASQSRTIQAVNGESVTVTTAYSETPQAEAVWVVESDELYAQQYRVVSVSDNNDGTFSITGAWHDPDKYARIDTGAIIDQRPVSVIPPGNQSPPANIVISSFSVVQQNISVETMRVSWYQAQNAIAYEAQWRRNDGNWVNVPRTSTTSFDVPGIYAGRYLVRVRAINAAEISSGWGYSEEKTLTGKVGNPPKPVGFIASENVVFGIELNWGFPANTDDTLKTEIQYSLTGTEDDAMLLADVPYPQRKYQQMGLKAGQIFWYRAQLVDRSGNESGYTEWVRGQASIDVSDITDVILEEIKDSDTFKDLIENAVDSNEKIAGMADEIKNHADELEQQAKDILENADGLAQAEVKIDEISVSMDGMTGGVKNSAIAIIQNGLAQVVSRRSQTATNAGNSASIDRVDTTIADTSQAVARALVTLDAEAGGNISNSTDLTETLADFTQASATKINTLTVKSGENSAAINVNAQAIADVNGNLSAMYNIKVGVSSNGQYYAAGMGIGVQNTPSGMQSQVIFLADRFAVTTMVGGTVTLPFVIQNGQAIIRDTVIGDGTISNAKIGNYIQSNNYVAGSVGWKLDKSGTFENYGSTAGEGAMKQTNQTISVKDGNNVLRVQVGRLTGVF
ncbi:TPA: host specificity protein J [Escherichia coli]|nr:host specificity protein J [Escherichia coli]